MINIYLALIYVFTSFTSLNYSLGIHNEGILILESLVRYYATFFCSFIYLSELAVKYFVDREQDTTQSERRYLLTITNQFLGMASLPNIFTGPDNLILCTPLLVCNFLISLFNFYENEFIINNYTFENDVINMDDLYQECKEESQECEEESQECEEESQESSKETKKDK